MSFDPLGLTPELLRAVADQGYTEPTPVQARGDPARPRRPRRPRRRPDRHRQDRRLRAADPPAAQRSTPDAGLRSDRRPAIRRIAAPRRDAPAADPLPRPHPDPRARAPGRGERPHLRRPAPDPLHRRSTAASASSARSAPCGPGPGSSSPRPAACSTTSASARSTCPGSRSSSSTRPTGCSTWASSATSARSSACSRRSARTSCSPRRSRTTSAASPPASSTDPAHGPGHAAQHRPSSSSRQVVHPVDRERKRELLSQLDHERPHRPGARLHPHQARRQPPRRAARARRHRRRRDPRQQEPAASASGRWPTSRPAGWRSSSRPTSPPAASTSTPCRTSSTSSCRWSPRTTSTASAGRAGPGCDGDAVSLVCVDESPLLREIERCSGRRSRSRSSRASRPTDRSGPSRSGCARPPGLPGGRVSRAEAVSVEPLPVEGRLGVGSRPPAGQTSGRPTPSAPGQFQSHPAGPRPVHPGAGQRQGYPAAGPRAAVSGRASARRPPGAGRSAHWTTASSGPVDRRLQPGGGPAGRASERTSRPPESARIGSASVQRAAG